MNNPLDAIRRCDMDRDYIFVSYSSKDSGTVHRDVAEFQRRGYNVWLDEPNLDRRKPSWRDDAYAAVENMNCALLIFYISGDSITSAPCLQELRSSRSGNAQIFHNNASGVPMIVVEVRPIGNIETFRNTLFAQIKADTTLSSAEKDEKVRAMYAIVTEFLQGNEKVRFRSLEDPTRVMDYYDEILSYGEAARVFPDRRGEGAPSGETPPPRRRGRPPKKQAAPTPMTAPEEHSGAGKDAAGPGTFTLAEIRAVFSDPDAVRRFRRVRGEMPWGGKSAMDYLMAAALGGCNAVSAGSSAWQINYYLYAVASGEKKGGGLGATWTWSSNCRKALGLEKAGTIPEEYDAYFRDLDVGTTLGSLRARFATGEEAPFRTAKEELVLTAADRLSDFLAGEVSGTNNA